VRVTRFLLAAALCAAGATGPAVARPAKPPMASGTNVSVWRGDRVPVTLRGFFGNNPVEYLIERPPRHGVLSPVGQPDPDRVAVSTDGSVVYRHDDSEDSRSDDFTFRVRAVRGGGLSAPATVRLAIMDRPPVLAAPAAVDFTAAAGESMTRSLGLTNAGGGVLEGALRVHPPFDVVGPGFFTLPRGHSTNIAVRYVPAAGGDTSRQPIAPGLNDSAGTQILLRGQSVAPFEATASGGDFVVDGQARETQVTLRSLAAGAQDITLTIDPPDLVEAPANVRLEPAAVRDLVLRIPAERQGERREVTLTFTTPAHRAQLVLDAPPVPAALELLTEELDFRERPSAVVTVANTGGVPGRFRFEPAAGLVMDNGRALDAREFVVPPGTEESVPLNLSLPPDTPPPAELVVHLAGREPERLAIRPPERVPTTPGPTPTATPDLITPPSEKAWILNQNIRIGAPSGGLRPLEWKTSAGDWQEPQLEVFRDGRWTPPDTPPAPPRGIIETIGDRISDFFRGLVPPRPPPTQEEPPPVPEWAAQMIDAAAAADGAWRWRLTARRGQDAGREPVSEEFIIDGPSGALARAVEARATAPPAPRTTTDALAPVLPVASARAAPGRRSARLQILFTRDPEADGYRLEHGIRPLVVDEKTGLPRVGDFLPRPLPEAGVKVLGAATVEHEGRELTVFIADVEGLAPGSASLWRVVTMAQGRDRRPTGEFLVHTLPPWQLPWRGVLLAAAFAALAAVLYLRWRRHRPPR
jgi:hypothetical protein